MQLRVVVALSALLSIAAATQIPSAVPHESSINCSDCEEWNRPQEPFRIFGNTYYVGVNGLSSILITSDAGHILVDAALPQSAPLIAANIRALGFHTEDIHLIVNSHEHFDHAGGIAALQRMSGATVAASAPASRALTQGYPTPEDPQYESGKRLRFPPAKDVEVIKTGDGPLRVGPLLIYAHFTPGHTPGATSWSWRSCEGARCLNVVYADSLSAVSDVGFRFTGNATQPSLVDSFRRSISSVERLACDIVIAPHPSAFGLVEKLARMKESPGTHPFIDANACRTYAASARTRLEQRLAEESK